MRRILLSLLLLAALAPGLRAQTTATASYATFAQLLGAGNQAAAYGALYQCYEACSKTLDTAAPSSAAHQQARATLREVYPHLEQAAYYYSGQNNQQQTRRFAEAYVLLTVHPAMQGEGLQRSGNYVMLCKVAVSATWNSREYARAIPLLRAYLDTGDADMRAVACNNLGFAYYRQGDLPRAKAALEEGLSQYPDNVAMLLTMVEVCQKNNDNAALQAWVPKAIASLPSTDQRMPTLINIQKRLYAQATPAQPAAAPTPVPAPATAPKPVAATPAQPAATVPQTPAPERREVSDVDVNIPENAPVNDRTFAVVIANEHYNRVAAVPHAANDGKMFAEYCHKVLGLPKENVRAYTDATALVMNDALVDIRRIAKAYGGDLDVIFYYAGHGVPDEETRDAFLLPVDASGQSTFGCMALGQLYKELGGLGARCVTVFLDACFSGSLRGEGMLASARGVAIKARPETVRGNVVVFSAATDAQTALPYEEKQHGLFTYFLLRKLQETKGNVTLSDLGRYLQSHVEQRALVVNRKAQTPTVSPSPDFGERWKGLRLRKSEKSK